MGTNRAYLYLLYTLLSISHLFQELDRMELHETDNFAI